MAQERKKNKQQQTEAQRLAHRDAVIEHSDNKFVAELTKNMDAFIYTKDFYVALYKQLESGMTSIEAYESLGFDTKKLGKNCAQSAAKRARQKAKNGEFEPKAENYDGSIPIEEMPEMSLEEKVAYQEARIRYLEDYVEFQKNAFHTGGDILILQRQEVKEDKLFMAYDYISRGKAKENGYTNTRVFKLFGVSSTGYYNYVARREDRDGKQAAKEMDESHVIQCFKKIIKTLGFVPGKRTFRRHMFRRFNYNISVSRASAIMKKMQITAQLPKKDAYKGQATHHHECMAKPNLVNRNFKLGVRQVILTDITYIHYGYSRTPAYMCAFKDAYTTEILGHYVSSRMDVSLVQKAFNNMMEKHKDEFPKNLEVYCHSDQGSQYLSTSFKQLLNENDFIQSMSRRGNSQDNAPMESFFGRMKTEVIDIIARCGDIATVRKLIDGYINMHNNERYQDTLAALSPSEFYTYKVTGQYPLDSYYGVKASELMPLEKIIEAKLEMQEKKKELRKERQKINEQQSRLLRNAGDIIMRDMKKMKDENRKWVKQQELVENQLKKISEIIEKISKALNFYFHEATAEVKKLLKDPLNWKNYTELDYYKDLDALY